MPHLVVKRVSTGREKKQFLEFPWTLYRGDPNWVPPLRSVQKEMVGYRRHPFYDNNRVQTFLACRGNEVCGRVAAILNQGHNARYAERRGFFGFFECVDDQQVADGLFDAVRQWFAEQQIHSLRGPTNPSLNHELGLLIDGFDSPPTFMMTYNPEYYARLIEGYGFRKTQDLYAYFGHVDQLPQIADKLEPVAEQIIQRYDVRMRPLDKSRFLEDVEAFLAIYNRSLVNTWGFVPLSKAEVRHMARGLRYLVVPQMTIGAEIDGKLVGACFGIPDYNPRIRQIDGRLFPFGFIRLLCNRRQIKRVRLVSTNVIPEYQLLGVGLALMHGLVPKALEWGLEEAEFSWVLESNSLSRGSLKKGGAQISKTYRLYDWDPPPPTGRPPAHGAAAVPRPVGITRHTAAAANGPLEIRAVGNGRDLERFCRVPWQIYREDPHWIPPLLAEVKEFLNPRRHPFYLHGAATPLLATRGGTPLGRILVSDDPRYNRQHGSNLGCFGMFECIDDREMAHALLGAAADWLRARGRSALLGPIDYSTNYPCGLLVDGFDAPPRVWMNHHRPYYAGLLESWGLTKARDLYAWWFLDPHEMLVRWSRRAQRLTRRGDVTIRPFRKGDFDAEIRCCRAVYNQAMRENWGFVELTEAEFRYLARKVVQLTVPDLVLVAEVDGQPVGFSVTLPDINEAIQPLGGRLTNFGLPINFARLIHRTRHVQTARMLALNVLENYRRRGIAELLILRTLEHVKNVIGYTQAELSWTPEDNSQANRTLEAVGARHYKTYRIYERSLDE